MMWAVGLMIALVLYVASIGPALVIGFRTAAYPGYGPDPWFKQLYWPILQLAENTWFQYELLEPYCEWWLHITNTIR